MDSYNVIKKNSKCKLLEIVSMFFTILYILFFIGIVCLLMQDILWLAFFIPGTFLFLPSLFASYFGFRYCEGDKVKLIACKIFGFISLAFNILIVYFISHRGFWGSRFYTDTLDGFDFLGYVKFLIFLFSIFCLPSILYLIACYKDSFILKFIKSHIKKIFFGILIIIILICLIFVIEYNKNKGLSEKINVDDVILPTLSEFENELISRGFIYELPKGMSELAARESIVGEDNKNKYQYVLSFKNDKDKRYPLFIYEGYESLIQKSDKTAYYYTIGPEDWWISWQIYYVNGQLYAVIGEESELDLGWEAELFGTSYGRIISESEKITTYNRKGNYFSYGGGIKNDYSWYLSTRMVDTFNSKCAEIIKVDRVDAETLDKIAKELSPRYWLEYKNNQ